MSIARGAAAAALVLAIVLIAVLLFRGGDVHEYDLLFQNAGQLVKDDDVQVGGRRIGSVREITLTDDNRGAREGRGPGAVCAAARGHARRRSA